MKNNVCIALLFCLLPMMIAKGEPNKLSKKAMMVFELKTILESDGLQPQMTDDGNLSFRINGNIYSLDIAEDDNTLYYARLSRFHKYESDITKEAIDLFNKEINYKAVKVLSAKIGYYLRSEFLLKDSQYFKGVYSRLIELMDKTYKTILENCPELTKNQKEADLTINSLKVLTEITDSTIVLHPVIVFTATTNKHVEYPVFLRLYRNNTLMQDETSPADYSCVDTLSTKNQNQPHLMKYWIDNPSEPVSYRCELWHNDNCIAISSYNTK